MASAVTHWREEHAYFQRLLELMHRQADCFAGGEKPNYELMLDIISYLRDYGDAVHHPREDVAFDRLVARVPDLALTVARLRQEHRVIAHAGEKLRGLLEAVGGGSVVPVHELETAAATYLVYFGNHIAKEDEDILPQADAVLTSEDWEAVRTAVPQRRDPLFGETPEERYRELRRQIALEAND